MKIEKKYFLLIILIICLLTAGVGCGKPANTSSKTNKSTKNEITQSNSDSNNNASIDNSTSASDNNVAAPNNTVNSSTEAAAVNNNSNQSNTSSTSKNNTVQQSSPAVKSDTQQSQPSTTAGNTQSTVPKASPPTPSTPAPSTSSAPASKAPAPPTVQTFTGFITTEDDFAANLREDTAFMIYMRLMALSGLGITIQQNGQWVFYYFDGNISTDNKGADGKWAFNGAGSQLTAWNIVEEQVKENNGANKMNSVPVTVTGTLSGNTKTNPGPDADGKQFPVISVKSITKN